MGIKLKIYKNKLYIFIISLALFIIFFSTTFSYANSFKVNNIEISKPFDINFNKNDAIDEGFDLAFKNLILKIIKSKDQKKLNKISKKELKSMIDNFSIKEERFKNEIYYMNLDVTFDKKKIYSFLNNQNIFPSLTKKKKILFIPIFVNESNDELFLFSENIFFEVWNNVKESHHQLDYILLTEDLEDISLIKKKYEFIEEYDFKEIINKYSIESFVISLIFKKDDRLRVLSKINLNKNIIIDNQIFENINLDSLEAQTKIVNKLKDIYEDYWKTQNQINSSIKLPLMISINNDNNKKISYFENSLLNLDLVSKFSIYKFENKKIFYKIIFNGAPKNFINLMKNLGHEFDIQNKIWNLK